MPFLKLRWNVLTIAALTLTLGLSLIGCGGGGSSDKETIQVIPKGTQHPYWNAFQAGAERAAKEIDAELTYQGPAQEKIDLQLAIVRNLFPSQPDGVVLCPVKADSDALIDQVRGVRADGAQVVIADSGLNAKAGEDFAAYVGTNNFEAGRAAGQATLDLLGPEGGKVLMIRYQPDSASTGEREAGWLEVVEAADNIEIVSADQYAGNGVDLARALADNLMDDIKACDLVYCPNQSTSLGMLRALSSSGVLGDIQFVAFDPAPDLVRAMIAGDVDAIVSQDPDKMGYEAVMAVHRAINGETVEQSISTGHYVVTLENLADDGVRGAVEAHDPDMPDIIEAWASQR